jgi:hypothetical protein
MRLTLNSVNNELAKRGISAILRKGEGKYFYFWGGETGDWWDRTVQVPKISTLSLDQWIEAYENLTRKNARIVALDKVLPKANKAQRPRTRKAGG